MMHVAWLVARLLSIFIVLTTTQTCPISTETAYTLNFSDVRQSCRTLDPAVAASCESCVCSLTNAVLPTLQSSGYDFQSTGGLAAAQSILQSCALTLAAPLAASRVPLTSLFGLTRCNYGTDNLPDCLRDLNPDSPEPMIEKQQGPESSREGGFVEGIAEDCQCGSEFDPVCDYGGFWYTNYCVAKCKGAKLVEHCTPVFKEIEERDNPFVLVEIDAPLLWNAGCFCPEDAEVDPVCDINGKQYPTTCYAHCLGVEEILECGALVVDFKMSGQGPIVEPKIEKQSGRESETTKPDVVIPNPDVKTPDSSTPSTNPPKATPSVEVPPEVQTMFHQLGVDVSSFPPELIIMAHSIIMGQQITDEQLQRAREILTDQERMTEARLKLTPSFLAQLELFAATATGANKILLDDLVAALKDRPDTQSKDNQSLTTCLKGCKTNKPVCDAETGEEYASHCHARCNGVTDTRPCYGHDESGVAGVAPTILLYLSITIFSIVIVASH